MILTILDIILLIILAILTLTQKNISKFDYIIILVMLIISIISNLNYKLTLDKVKDRYKQAEDYKQQMLLEQDSRTNNRDTRE